MNILFLVKSFSFGGVEIVTATLAGRFVNEGHNVVILSMLPNDNNLSDRLDSRVHFYEGVGFNSSSNTIKTIRNIYETEKIQIVINQWGLHYIPIRAAQKAAKGLDIKFISVFHNDPSTNGRLQNVQLQLNTCNKIISRAILLFKYLIYKKITSISMRYVYGNSDRFMILSPSFVGNFKDFTGIKSCDKLIIQTNPITIKQPDIVDLASKTTEVLFVGRFELIQKRIDRILYSWQLIENKYPDWKLSLVGDGEDRNTIQQLISELKLNNVSLEGYKNPIEYYTRASILVLTSEFEGFPLVIAEAMRYGVVPVVLDSYAAAKDIISNNVNGLLIQYIKEEGFNKKLFASAIASLMENKGKREKMALYAIERSQYFSLDRIYNEWIKTIEAL